MEQLDELAQAFDDLPSEEQSRFLARLAHELTISVRGCYSDTPQVVSSAPGSRVGNLNEVQHRVLGFLRDVLDDAPGRASGHDVLATLLFWAGNGQVEADVTYSIERAMSHCAQGGQSGRNGMWE